jgi:hypothetical protein
MNSCKFREIIVLGDFEVENGVLGLERDIHFILFILFCHLTNRHLNYFNVLLLIYYL